MDTDAGTCRHYWCFTYAMHTPTRPPDHPGQPPDHTHAHAPARPLPQPVLLQVDLLGGGRGSGGSGGQRKWEQVSEWMGPCWAQSRAH